MGAEFEIPKEIELPASLEQAWQAIATGPGVAAWFMPMEIDPDSAEVAVWDPPRRLTIRSPQAEDGSTDAFDYLVESRGGSTVLRFVHSGVFAGDWSDEYEGMTSKGWDMYLHTLAQYLRHFPGRAASYVEAEAPMVDGGWQRLHGVLGSARLGAQLKVELPGGQQLPGSVDYLTENFLGLHTPDSLIRFHERSPIGMPIAVSEHVYTELADPAGRVSAWQNWLARAVKQGA